MGLRNFLGRRFAHWGLSRAVDAELMNMTRTAARTSITEAVTAGAATVDDWAVTPLMTREVAVNGMAVTASTASEDIFQAVTHGQNTQMIAQRVTGRFWNWMSAEDRTVLTLRVQNQMQGARVVHATASEFRAYFSGAGLARNFDDMERCFGVVASIRGEVREYRGWNWLHRFRSRSFATKTEFKAMQTAEGELVRANPIVSRVALDTADSRAKRAYIGVAKDMADSIEHGTASDVAMQTANSALGRSLMVPSSTESRRAVADALLEYQDSWHVLFPWMRRSVSKAATETAIDETTNVLLLRAKRALCSRNAKAVLDAQIENLRGRIRIGLQHNDTVPYAQDLRNTLTECIELRLLFRDNISQVRDDDVLRALDYVKNSRLQGKDNLARIELLPAAARAFSDSITELLSAGTQHVGKITPDIVYRVYFPSVFGYTPSQQFFNDLVAGLRSRGWNRAAGLITGARGNTFLPISNFGGDCKTLRKMATLTTENGAELVSDSDRLRVLLFDTEHAFRGLESHTTAIATLDSYADPTVLRQLAMKRAKDISKPVMKDFGVKDPFGQIEFDWASTYHRPFYKNIGYFCAPYYRICRETVMFVPKVCTNVIKAGYETVVGWSKTAKNFRDRLTTKIGDSPSVGFLKGAAKGVVGTLQTITANAAWYWLEDYSPFDMWDLARADAKKAEDAFYAKKSIEAGYTKEDIEAGKDMRGKDMRVDAEATLVNTQTFLKAAGTEVTDALLIRSPLVKTKYGARYLLFKAVDRLIIWNTDGRSNALSLLLTDPTSVAEDVKAKYQEYRGKNLTGKRLEEQRKADEASKEAEDKNVKSEPEAAIKRADVVPWPSGTVHPGTNPQIFPYSEKAGDTLVFAVQVEVEGEKKWLFSREAGGLIHFTTNIPRNAVRSPAALELRSFLQDNLHLESVISPTEWSRRKNDILKKVAEKPSLRDIKISAIEWKSEKDIFHDLLRGEGIACIGEKKTDGGHSVYFYPNIRENQHTI